MPTYKLILEVEVNCPTEAGRPELTIDAQTVLKSLLSAGNRGCGGYAVCDRRDMHKLTAYMAILSAKFIPPICEHCGQELPVV